MKFRVELMSRLSIVVEAKDEEQAIEKAESKRYSNDILRNFAAYADVVNVEECDESEEVD